MASNTVAVFVMAVMMFASTTMIELVASERQSPIVIVPGLLGSRLDVTGLDDCYDKDETVPLWLNVPLAIFGSECFTTPMKFKFDTATGHYSNFSDTAIVTVPGFGEVDITDPGTATEESKLVTFFAEKVFDISPAQLLEAFHLPEATTYFKKFVNYFVKRGYKKGKSIRIAPYDWRLTPDLLQKGGYYGDLKKLIETMYKENENSKVTIVAHSYGGLVSHHFLTTGIVSESWKDQYIENFVTLGTPWAGTFKSLQNVISGYNYQISIKLPSFINDIVDGYLLTAKRELREVYRTFPSTPFLYMSLTIWGDKVIVSTPKRDYTANDYQDLFKDLDYPDGYKMYVDAAAKYGENYPKAPNVRTYCFYGHKKSSTVNKLEYKKSFPNGANKEPENIVRGVGDGTVPIESLAVCQRWEDDPAMNGQFTKEEFPGVDHQGIVFDDDVLKMLEEIATTSDPEPLNQPPKDGPSQEPSVWKKLWKTIKNIFG